MVEIPTTNYDSSWTAGPSVRIGPDFWSEILLGPVLGPDFGPEFYLVRSLVRIFGPDFAGPVRGPEFGPKIRSGFQK